MTRRLPYRARLTLAYTVVVAFAVVILGGISFLTVRFAIDNALDTRLTTTAQAIASIVDVNRGVLHLDAQDRTQFIAILGQSVDGAVLQLDGTVLDSDLESPPKAVIAAVAKPGVGRGTVKVGRDTIVFVCAPILSHGARVGTAAVWDARGTYDDAISATLAALGLAGIIVVLLAIAVGGALSRQLLRPVTELSTLISSIEAADLKERLRWEGADDELGRLCETFNRLLDRLEAVVARERRFIADASHELRTPLSVMRAEVELALMYERKPEAYREALARLRRETQRLEQLAEGLLLTTRRDAKSIVRLPLRLADAAQRATDRMQILATSRDISLTAVTHEPVHVYGDSEMLESAVAALISNALRFAPDHGAIWIETSRKGDRASIVVRDDGPGFSSVALNEATTRFWREDAARSGPGTGLGLSIVRAIVERHSGTIELRNADADSGAVVELLIPLLVAPAVTHAP